MMRYIPSDFEMNLTPAGFQWQSADMAGIPLIRTPDGSIFEPFLRYFAYGDLHKIFKAKSSMEPDSYSLRDYLCHCYNSGITWISGGSDEGLRTFRNTFPNRVKEGELSAAQVELKLHHVFQFYRTIPRAMPFVGGGLRSSIFVGNDDIAPITTRRSGKALRWSGWNNVTRSSRSRPVPDSDDVERILEHLRAAAMEPLDGSWEQSLRVFAAERNWLIGCCEVRAGLRRGEVKDLSLRKIAEAMSKEAIIRMAIGRWRNSAESNPLADAAHDKELQKQIIAGIEKFMAQGNTTLSVDVQAKGSNERSVEFPLDLVLDLLKTAVWRVKKALFARWKTEGKTKFDEDAVFISSTGNGARVGLKQIGGVVKGAFNALNIAGSGHRLRAYYLTEMAWLLWNQELAKAGYRADLSVSNNVLNRLAELAGHKQPTTTERYYLGKAKKRYDSKSNLPTVEARRDMMNAMISVSWRLSQENCVRMKRLIYAFDDCEDDRFFRVVDAAVEKYVVVKDRPSEEKAQPRLKVVSDNTGPKRKKE